MYKKSNLKNLLSIVIILCLFWACNPPETQKSGGKQLKITDVSGRLLNLKLPVKRVVCCIESGLSTLYMLNVQDEIIGIPSCVYQDEIFNQYSILDSRIKNKELASPGNWDFVSLEKIVSLKPDLVIIWASQKEAVENLEKLGIPVYTVMISNIQDIYKEVSDFGAIFEKQARADSLIDYTKSCVNDIYELSKKTTPKKIYFSWSQGMLETSGRRSMVNELISTISCQNICEIDDEHCVINKENLIAGNPDLIVMWVNEKLNPSDFYEEKSLSSISAIKNKNVVELPTVFETDFWTLKFVQTLRIMAKASHPEVFEQLNLSDEKPKMFKTLYGKEL
jgi:iron complex transport system substrate-binding protein